MGEAAKTGAAGWRAQFGHPRGALGWLVGHAMAIKNAARGRWVRGLLDAAPGDRVLEIGCGPGVDLAALAGRVGFVAGVDISSEMVRQASARARAAIARGAAAVKRGSVDALPFDDKSFDRAFAVNSVQFWPDLPGALRELARVLRPGGRLAVAIQPRSPGATEATTRQWDEKLAGTLRAAGFVDVRSEWDRRPRVPVVCALASRG